MNDTHSISCTWNEDLSFDADIDGHLIKIDTDEASGGKNYGARPKPLILTALAGCTGIDVAGILKKMRIPFEDLKISVIGTLRDEHPKYYNKIHIKYKIKGKEINLDNVEKAIRLSHDKYCGVYAMLKEIAEITYEVKIIE